MAIYTDTPSQEPADLATKLKINKKALPATNAKADKHQKNQLMNKPQEPHSTDKFTNSLSEFLGIEVDSKKLEAHSISHYSFSKKSADLDIFSIQGSSFISLISSHFAITQDYISEEEISVTEKAINKLITQTLSERLIKSDLYRLIGFGPGVSDLEKKSHATLCRFVDIALGMAVQAGYFISIYRAIEERFTGCELPASKDSKTTLQELTQKIGISTPHYETISMEGPAHDRTFLVECSLKNGLRTRASARSKKLAEGAAATSMITKNFPDHAKKIIKLSRPRLDLLSSNTHHQKYTNTVICKNFNIPPETNLNPCFIPARFKRTGGWNGRSHRPLATHGANVLDYLVCHFSLEQIKHSPSRAKSIKADNGRSILNTSELISTVASDGLWPSSVPYKHPEIDNSEEYKSDCIQSLFAVSFLDALSNG